MANSPGWKPIGPSSTQMRAPLIVWPRTGTSGSRSSPTPSEQERVAEAGEVAGPADDRERGDEGADADRRPHRLEAGEAAGIGLASSRRAMNT